MSVYVPDAPELITNFKKGDMLYGLHADREKFRDVLMKKVTEGFIVTVDPFNNGFLTQTLKKSGFQADNASDAIDYMETRKDNPIPKEYSLAYSEFLVTHKRFSPARNDPSKTFPGKDAQTARSCKAMIEFTLSRGNSVHFLLDSLAGKDMETVVKKGSLPPGKGFTNAELRYVYRNRNRGIFKSGVKFYRNGKLCKAPWEDEPALWQHYVPKHEYTD